MSKTNKIFHSDECDEDESTESDTSTVNNEGEGGNVDIEDFYDVFGDLDEYITENTSVWVNTKKTFGKVRSLKYHTVRNQRIPSI